MGRPGRPSKLSAELQAAFCELIASKGLFRKHAAAKIGVPERTISNWYHRGAREERGPYRAFTLAVDQAEATFAEAGLESLQSIKGDPKVTQWLLSRRFPELFGRKDNVEDQNPDDRAAQQQATRTLLMERLERLFPDTPSPPAPVVEAPPSGPALAEGKPDAAQ